MELKSLYNEWEASSTDAHDLYTEVSRTLEPIMLRMRRRAFACETRRTSCKMWFENWKRFIASGATWNPQERDEPRNARGDSNVKTVQD